MLVEGLNNLLKGEIKTVLAPLSNAAGLCDLVKEPLSKLEQDLVTDTTLDRAWFFLPLYVCDAICGHYEQALPASIGLELLKTAAEIFDDIEDADSDESLSAKYGTPLAINVASTLLILAERAFIRLKSRGVDSGTVTSLIDAVNSYYTIACLGQHLDLTITPQEAVSEDVYLRVIGMKSASTVECACYTGALLAGANQELIKLFIIFGHNLGMASQIANDIKGITSLRDIRKRKITLPVIYALAQTDGEYYNTLDKVFYQPNIEFIYIPERIRDLLFNAGAIQYAMIKEEIYKQQATDTFTELEQAGVKLEQLQQFLE